MKRLYVRQLLAYREGKSNNSAWFVGYWDKKPNLDADQAFRALTSKPTESEAAIAAKEISAKRKEFFYE